MDTFAKQVKVPKEGPKSEGLVDTLAADPNSHGSNLCSSSLPNIGFGLTPTIGCFSQVWGKQSVAKRPE